MGESLLYFVVLCLSLVNALAFFLFGMDKWKARHARRRIPESALLTVALLGGALGAWIGMKCWHHKTLHARFRYGVPFLLITQFLLLGFAFCKL